MICNQTSRGVLLSWRGRWNTHFRIWLRWVDFFLRYNNMHYIGNTVEVIKCRYTYDYIATYDEDDGGGGGGINWNTRIVPFNWRRRRDGRIIITATADKQRNTQPSNRQLNWAGVKGRRWETEESITITSTALVFGTYSTILQIL